MQITTILGTKEELEQGCKAIKEAMTSFEEKRNKRGDASFWRNFISGYQNATQLDEPQSRSPKQDKKSWLSVGQSPSTTGEKQAVQETQGPGRTSLRKKRTPVRRSSTAMGEKTTGETPTMEGQKIWIHMEPLERSTPQKEIKLKHKKLPRNTVGPVENPENISPTYWTYETQR